MQRRMTPRRSTISTIAVVVAATGLLSACTTEMPAAEESPKANEPITISVNANSMEQAVLGEIYHQVLESQDRESSVVVANNREKLNRMQRLQTGDANFVIGCTGDLLGSMNPQGAEALVDEFLDGDERTNVNDTELLLRTYDEFVGSLPGDITTTDPSPAQGCLGAEQQDLPQNIVPVFDKGLFDRSEYGAISGMTRALNTEELTKLVQRARRMGSVTDAVDNWMNTNTSKDDLTDNNTDNEQK